MGLIFLRLLPASMPQVSDLCRCSCLDASELSGGGGKDAARRYPLIQYSRRSKTNGKAIIGAKRQTRTDPRRSVNMIKIPEIKLNTTPTTYCLRRNFVSSCSVWITGDDLGFTIAFPVPMATRLPKNSNVIPEGTVSARTELATTQTDRSNPSVAAITRQNFRSLAVGSIWQVGTIRCPHAWPCFHVAP